MKETFNMRTITVKSDSGFNVEASKSINTNGFLSISVRFAGSNITVTNEGGGKDEDVFTVVEEIIKTLSEVKDEQIEF